MRLLGVHRIHYRKGGAESVHLDHLDLFRQRGWECAEFAMAHPDNQPSPWERYFPGTFEPETGGLLTRIAKVPRFLHSSEAATKFAAMLDDFRPDIIHIHGLYQQLTTSVLKPALKRGIPMVYTLHDFKIICPNYFFFNRSTGVCEKCSGGRQWNALLNRCSGSSISKDAVQALDGLVQWYGGGLRAGIQRFVSPSRFLLEKMVANGIDRGRLAYVPNFFENTHDVSIDPARVAELRARHGRFLLYFGRLSPEKGLDVLLAAARQTGVPLVFVGDGPSRAELEALAAREGVPAVFAGFKSGAELWAYVSAATVVALPSIWYENAPKSVLEAQSRGKVVITSAIGGLPEMIEDGVTGFLARSGDSTDLARVIAAATALDDAALAAIGDRARIAANSTFTRDRYYRETVAVYDDVLAEGVRAAG